jgi:hypothetical protein
MFHVSSIRYNPLRENARVGLSFSVAVILEDILDYNPSSYRGDNTSIMMLFGVNDDNVEPFSQSIRFSNEVNIARYYISPVNGIEAVLHSGGSSLDFNLTYSANFTVNNIIYWINFAERFGNTIDEETGFNTLKAIIDAFW